MSNPLIAFHNRAFAVPDTLAGVLGLRVLEADDDHVVVGIEGKTGARQPGTGLWLGEALEAMAGLCAAVMTVAADESTAEAIDLTHGATSRSVHFLRTSSSDSVRGEARWVRRGRRQAVVEVTVVDGDGRELLRMLSEHYPYPEPYRMDINVMEHSPHGAG